MREALPAEIAGLEQRLAELHAEDEPDAWAIATCERHLARRRAELGTAVDPPAPAGAPRQSEPPAAPAAAPVGTSADVVDREPVEAPGAAAGSGEEEPGE